MGVSRPSAKGRPNYVMGVWGRRPQRGPGAKPLVRGPPEADDVFLFQRLISLQNYLINLGNLDYMARVRGVYASIGGGAQSHFSHAFTAGPGRLPLHVSWRKHYIK